MITTIGHVRELTRYPVKSMAGVSIDSATLGWHGLEGDRRLAFRRIGDESGFPWLSASSLPQLVLYRPVGVEETARGPLPTHVRTPRGNELLLRSAELRDEVIAMFGSAVELAYLRNGIFDDASASVISTTTMAAICGEAGVTPDHRRFRPNVVIETDDGRPFVEDEWIGSTLLFGEQEPRPAIAVTDHDIRCVMISLDPDTAVQNPAVLKAAVRLNGNNAGVYGTVVQTGTIRVGDKVAVRR